MKFMAKVGRYSLHVLVYIMYLGTLPTERNLWWLHHQHFAVDSSSTITSSFVEAVLLPKRIDPSKRM